MSETDSEPKTKDDVYRERNLLALALIRQMYDASRMRAHERGTKVMECGWWLDRDDVNGEQWAVVWANTPAGQIGYHVPREMVPDWLDKKDPNYDGYATEEKNRRVQDLAGIETEITWRDYQGPNDRGPRSLRDFLKHFTDGDYVHGGRRFRCAVCEEPNPGEYSDFFGARQHAQYYHDYPDQNEDDSPFFVPEGWSANDEFDVLHFNEHGRLTEIKAASVEGGSD